MAAVQVGLYVSAARCLLTYVVAPVAGTLGCLPRSDRLRPAPARGAITSAAGARRLWQLGHPARFLYAAIAIAVCALAGRSSVVELVEGVTAMSDETHRIGGHRSSPSRTQPGARTAEEAAPTCPSAVHRHPPLALAGPRTGAAADHHVRRDPGLPPGDPARARPRRLRRQRQAGHDQPGRGSRDRPRRSPEVPRHQRLGRARRPARHRLRDLVDGRPGHRRRSSATSGTPRPGSS